MSETNTGTDVVEGASPREEGDRPSPTVGAYLREGRERKALSILQIAEITRLRPHMVEAIENEAWDRLPPPVFVKGFIRAYARALGLDERKAHALYMDSVPVEIPVPGPVDIPARSKTKAFLVLLALGVGALLIMRIWWGSPPPPQRVASSTQERAGREGEKGSPQGDVETVSIREQEPHAGAYDVSGSPHLRGFPLPEGGGGPGPGAGNVRAGGQGEISPGPITQALEGVSPGDGFALVANVDKATWIRITIDDQAPKEYLFTPGSRPQWRAKRGFDLIVGNAGGVEFDFNGRKIGNLGKAGQVVRLTLPEGFRQRGGEG